MKVTIIYGESADIQHREIMEASEAFKKIHELSGWAFIDIYCNNRLVYTTQGAAGYRYICKKCPYSRTGKKVTMKQYNAIYDVR